MEVKDQLNRLLKFDKSPQKIISLVPSITELLVDLGLEDKIVGITQFCVHPIHLKKEKTVVGGTKTLHFDRIKELNPDLILANKEENIKEQIEEIAKDFKVHISDVNTLEDNYQLIKQYGEIFGVQEKANEIILKTKKEEIDFQLYLVDKPKLKVAYFIWRKPWMVVGGDTFVNHLIERNKFENVYAEISRYPEVEVEKLRFADFFLLSSEPFPFAEKHKKELEIFVNDTQFRFVDGEFFSWYGSRLQQAFKYFKELREGLEALDD